MMIFFVHISIESHVDLLLNSIVKSITVWTLIFGITGLFLRYGSKHSAIMRYVSDSSYWVYLVHLTPTLIIPGLIASWPIHALLKFLFVTLVTGILCFVTYHFLVRNTFIGKFLNGRKYSKRLDDIKVQEEVQEAA